MSHNFEKMQMTAKLFKVLTRNSVRILHDFLEQLTLIFKVTHLFISLLLFMMKGSGLFIELSGANDVKDLYKESLS